VFGPIVQMIFVFFIVKNPPSLNVNYVVYLFRSGL